MMAAGDRLERYGVWLAVAAFLCTRAIVLVVALLAPQDRTRPDAPAWWSDVPLVRWDAGHYGRIMMDGYPAQISDTAAFFPGYPLFARPFAVLFKPEVALIVASHVAALACALLFYAWARGYTDARTALWAVMLWSCYPPAMFLSAGYADAVFVACVVAALWLLQRRQFWLAAVASAYATATRPTGLALAAVVVLAVIAYGPRSPWPRRVVQWIAIGAIAVSGLVAYELFLWHHYGRADAFFAAQASWTPAVAKHPWHRILSLTPVIQPALQPVKSVLRGDFGALLEAKTWNATFNLLAVILGFVGLLARRKRGQAPPRYEPSMDEGRSGAEPVPVSGGTPRVVFLLPIFIFLLAYLPDPVNGGRLVGIARYQLAALPCFALLAGWRLLRRWPAVFVVLLAALFFLQCLYVRGFCNWILVG